MGLIMQDNMNYLKHASYHDSWTQKFISKLRHWTSYMGKFNTHWMMETASFVTSCFHTWSIYWRPKMNKKVKHGLKDIEKCKKMLLDLKYGKFTFED